MRTLSILLWSLCLVLSLHGQQRRWETGIQLGGARYQGDLTTELIPQWDEIGPAAGIFTRYALGKQWGLRGGLWYGQFSGTDQLSSSDFILRERNLRFDTEVMEVALQLEWEPFGKKRYPQARTFRPIVSPYLFAGGGLSRIEARPDFSRTSRDYYQEDIEADRSADFPLYRPVIPLGAGVRIDLSAKVVMGVELGTRTTFSDFVDGISHTGRSDTNDWYVFGGLSFARRFGPKDSDRDGFADKEDACPQVAGVASARGCPDRDADGVEDLEDLCPDNYGLPRLSGCPDLDGDEIIDLLDDCPKIAGSPDTNGCPDTDGDCIADAEDDCPEDPGFEEWNGCPDTDFDGIIDREDDCPEVAGLAERNGCPFVDTDKDGVEDELDKCPEKAGTEAMAGCPDTDGDGLPDNEDRCPETPGESTDDGCPPLAEADKAILKEAREEVQFNTGQAVLKEESYKVLDRIVELMKRYPDYSLRIAGHTDSVGKASDNQALSEQRAEACFHYLVEKGISKEAMEHNGFGETRPIGDNTRPEGRRKNRRVEFELFLQDKE